MKYYNISLKTNSEEIRANTKVRLNDYYYTKFFENTKC